MKNTQLYPFERNKYYYGMLLSVEDFNSEQKYMNDKRRLVNRLVHGTGVVSGLNVVAIDDQTISVESGLAFDNTGREILYTFALNTQREKRVIHLTYPPRTEWRHTIR